MTTNATTRIGDNKHLKLLISGYIRVLNHYRLDNILLEILDIILIFYYGDAIHPDPSKIETTEMIAKRLNEYVFAVVHTVNWSKVLELQNDWKIDISLKKQIEKINDGFTIPILSKIECKKLIELSELYGYVHCGNLKIIRNNTRMVTNDYMFASKLYDRMKSILPSEYKYDNKIWTLCGINERFRFCKYSKGQKFGIHYDEQMIASEIETSYYTLVIYLNDGSCDFKGGRLGFFLPDHSANDTCNYDTNYYRLTLANTIIPATGLAAVFNHFPHKLYHSGEEVYDGVKYLIQTEVMYRIKRNRNKSKHKS